MSDEQLKQLKQKFKDKLQKNVSFTTLTTVKIGGPAKAYLEVASLTELTEVTSFCALHSVPFFILGGGSNLLVADNGLDALVIKIGIKGILKDNQGLLKVSAGTVLQDLIDFSIKNSLSGLHKMTGIPGTVGGAIYGNAGAYGQMIGNHVMAVVAFDPKTGQVINLTHQECGFEYRDSSFKRNGLIIIEALFDLPKGDTQTLVSESAQCLTLRQIKYKPGTLCPGSFFKNLFTKDIPKSALAKLPPRKDTFGKTPAFVFIEALGLKGRQIGQIKIAPYHGNLFINSGGGQAKDFWQLAKECFDKTKEGFGVVLEPEVQLVNLPTLDS